MLTELVYRLATHVNLFCLIVKLLFLSQHPSAAAILLDVGAVDFLTQLRTNLDPAHQNTVDAILNNLFHLPSVETSQHLPECIYQPCSLSG